MIDYPPPDVGPQHRPVSAVVRLAAAVGVGVLAGAIASVVAPWQTIPLLAWDATALTWVTAVWWRVGRMDAVATSSHATFEDPRRATADAMLLSASVISLVAVVLGVIKAGSTHGSEKAVLLGAGVLTIMTSWGIVHTLFTLRYAHLYYTGPDGGVDFNEDDKPSYADFAYLAFTIAMTYQVSDTDLTTKAIRHTALRHALLSYMFGTIIIAATINLAAGLVK
ncbi:MAG: DUF1345 domain-containing protein [Actinomycetota bacterium]|nr:DUF1345 domain-containing protein [Actinomycetota bacterium]